MAAPGDVIENPVTGERVVFLQTGEQTGGALLQAELFVRPGGFVAAEHVHPLQEERFAVRAGTLMLRVAGRERRLVAGEAATIPPGTPHVWWNDGAEELHVLVELRPAGRFDRFLETFFALAHAGKTDRRGLPNLLQMAVSLRTYGDTIYPASPPRAVQRVLVALLAPVGRLLGYEADCPYPRPERPRPGAA
ncbi:MAG TPA: cupin domain-containing protein [Rubricoccaceae bacterium]|nr:cupin domain-containing protein [Rubricoccaceae bacterium]